MGFMHLDKFLLGVAMLWILSINVAFGNQDIRVMEQYADQITANLPATWRVVEKQEEVIPYGHYDGLKYDGPKGISLLLEGEQDVHLYCKYGKRGLHKEAVAKETLELWIMPSEYHRTWKRFFQMYRRVPAKLLYSDKAIKVYGYLSHRAISHEKLREALRQCSETDWPDSPKYTGVLSWKKWKEDIKKILMDSQVSKRQET